MDNRQLKIKTLSEQIDINPFSAQMFLNRSQVYTTLGNEEQAIIDLSKSLYLQKSCKSYILRGQLYAKMDKFTSAIEDFQQASTIYNDEKPIIGTQSEVQTFMSGSICIKQLPNMKRIIHTFQSKQSQIKQSDQNQIKQLLKHLFCFHELLQNKVSKNQEINQFQIQKYNQLLEMQNKVLKQQQQQINQLAKQIKYRRKDYYLVFEDQLDISSIAEEQKQHLRTYFQTFCHQMERYYLSAKILKEFNNEKISFQDFNNQENQNKIVKNIFKIVDKLKGKIQRVQQIIKQLPYLGSIFKIIKYAAKGVHWLDQTKQINECENILLIAPTSSSFNYITYEIAYHLVKHYKFLILSANNQVYRQSEWRKLKDKYWQNQKKQLSGKVCPKLQNTKQKWVKQVGQIHSSIVIMAFAYGRIYAKNMSNIQFYENIYEIIDPIDDKLKTKEEQSVIEKQKYNIKNMCNIF